VPALASLTPTERAFLAAARTATLATRPADAADGAARLVPVCFVALDPDPATTRVYTPLDDKPKRTADPRALARVRDILADPRVTLLVDRWDEDWSHLGWLRFDGRATLLEPGAPATAIEHRRAVEALRAKYPQYAGHALETRPVIAVTIVRVSSWGDLSDPDDRGTRRSPSAGGSGSSSSPGDTPRR
jgi:PPOX class probable F420-dependent enzyme